MLLAVVQALIAILVAGGCAYYLLVLEAARRYLNRRSARRLVSPREVSFSVLKPLAGDEHALRSNLESFFRLDQGDYEILFAARSESDPALALARTLVERYPEVRTSTLVAGEPLCPNAKVHSLAVMTSIASGEVLVVSDSDIRTDSALLRALASEFDNPRTGVVTCPSRAVPGPSLWSLLEAIGINTEFWSGVLAAQMVMPMDFAVGPTMAVRRACLEAIGGWDSVKLALAEDFQIGQLARRAGYDVRLATHVVEHRIGGQGMRSNLAHRLRWRRSTRRSRPIGYFGEVFANPLPWAIALVAFFPTTWAWALLATCSVLRLAVSAIVSRSVLRDPLTVRFWWLVPVQDFLSFVLWFVAFFGNRIVWRDRVYELAKDGSLRRLEV